MFEEITADKLSDILLPVDQWNPIPVAADRAAWESCDAELQSAAISEAEALLGTDWPVLPAALYLDFARTGNRERYQRPCFKRRSNLQQLVMGECMEHKGRFMDDIANGIWAICEESSWCIPAHVGRQRSSVGLPDVSEPIVDLFAAQTAEGLAWTHTILAEQLDDISPLIRQRIRSEIKTRIMDPCFARTDFWWMGTNGNRVNNWNPWICSNWLTCVLLFEQDSHRRVSTVHRILNTLDRFIDAYLPDGGCDEGPGYWNRAGASLFDCLDVMHSATDGRFTVYDDSLIRNIGAYIYKAHVSDCWLLNFADAGAKGYSQGNLIFRYGRAVGDTTMQQHGAWLMQRQNKIAPGHAGSYWRTAKHLFDCDVIDAFPNAEPPLVRDVWLDGIEVSTSRNQAGDSKGLYLAAKGGHNAESHNHNDVGHFVIFKDGKPALIDIGVETYSAATFSEKRYTIWTMQSAWHNLPTINGVMQSEGRRHCASNVEYKVDDERSVFSLDISKAYPEDAGIQKWQRTLTHVRSEHVHLHEQWMLNAAPESLELSLITPCKVTQHDSFLELASVPLPGGQESGDLRIDCDGSFFTVEVEDVHVEDGKLQATWGEELHRIHLRCASSAAQGEWQLIFS